MKKKPAIKLPLTYSEKASLRKNKISLSGITDFAADELEVLLGVTAGRAKELLALAEFQTVPSVGIKFAGDLVFSGYYSLRELQHKDGTRLTDEYERKKGFWTDPCVEDQFRLVVHVASTGDRTKNWWQFTEERKAYRSQHGYPPNRPGKPWFEVAGYKQKGK